MVLGLTTVVHVLRSCLFGAEVKNNLFGMNYGKRDIFREDLGLLYKSRIVYVFPVRFWAFTMLSNSVVQFGWLKKQFLSEFEREEIF